MPPVLVVEGLRLYYGMGKDVVKAIDGVFLELDRGRSWPSWGSRAAASPPWATPLCAYCPKTSSSTTGGYCYMTAAPSSTSSPWTRRR
ncbi:MAG: hypothetical protein RXQ56_00210 [Thermoproteus sp.]